MCSLQKPICGVIILQDFLNPNGIPGIIATIGKSSPLPKKELWVCLFGVFLVIHPVSILYMFEVQLSTNCDGVAMDHTLCILHMLSSVQTKQNNLFGRHLVTLCFAVFYGSLAYRFLYNVELLLLFMEETRILKILSHRLCPVNPVKNLIYPELSPVPKNKSGYIPPFLSTQTVLSNLE